jgi:soluble lytic murein transglycosylase-like protein
MRELMLTCVLEVLAGNARPCSNLSHAGTQTARAHADAIAAAVKRYPSVPAEIAAAVVRSESNFNAQARGDGGQSFGPMQLKLGGAIPATYPPRKALHLPTNVRLGVRYLAEMQKRCRSTDPAIYLSKYNGRGCKRSSYSKKVLGRLAVARKTLALR